MSEELINLGESIFNEIDQNDYLNSIYDNMLYNYALIKFHLTSVRQRRDYDVNAALQFADLLSNSTHTSKADDHKMWAQEIISLLLELEPENEQVKYYAGSVLTNVGNFRGRELVKSSYTERTLQEKAFATFCKQYLTIPADKSKTFFLFLKNIYDRLSSNFLSYSAPTSMGKSFIMHMFIKEQIMNGVKMNFARNSKNSAIENARLFADRRAPLNDPELKRLASDIKREVHGDYFLSDIVEKGVAYHIGYLPSSIRSRIEELFKDGKITTMFCTSTLIEGVNLPADNLFIANNYNGRPKMSGVEFKNLIGRVGRIKFNLYGNVFFVTDGKRTTEKEYLELLREPVKEQKLSVVQDLKPKLKKHIVEALLEGDAVIDKYNDSQPEEEYIMMRKFGLILLQDIVDERDSLVKREFSKQLSNDDLLKIKNLYDNSKNYIDNDINISVDQTKKLAKAIREGSHFPEAENGYFSHKMVYKFLDELRQIFDWDRYEYSTLGKKDKDGEYRMLSWYAVILSQWMEGHGLNNIMRKALTFRSMIEMMGSKLHQKHLSLIF